MEEKADLRALVVAAQARDEDAFQALWERHERHVRGLLLRIGGIPATAEDLAQETALRAWKAIRSLQAPEAFTTWLERIAMNLALGELRSRDTDPLGSCASSELNPEVTAAPPPSSPVRDEHLDDLCARILEVARSACRPVELQILLLVYRGQGLGEAAALLGLKPVTARSHWLRARGRLLARLFTRHHGLVGGGEAIARAYRKARSIAPTATDSASHLLTEAECRAFEHHVLGASGAHAPGRETTLLSACVKVARSLPFATGRLR